jgi:hypothetical protein
LQEEFEDVRKEMADMQLFCDSNSLAPVPNSSGFVDFVILNDNDSSF